MNTQLNENRHMSDMSQDALAAHGRKPVLFPVGAIEQHGNHMPLDTDTLLATRIAESLAARMDALIAPGFSYGCYSLPNSGGGERFYGTFGIRGATFAGIIEDVGSSLMYKGLRRIAVVNGHMENIGFVAEALRRLSDSNPGAKLVLLNWWELVDEVSINSVFGGEFPGWDAEHAGILETSLMLHLAPNRVEVDKIEKRTAEIAPPDYVVFPEREGLVDSSGVLRTADGASSRIGAALTEAILARAVEILSSEFETAPGSG